MHKSTRLYHVFFLSAVICIYSTQRQLNAETSAVFPCAQSISAEVKNCAAFAASSSNYRVSELFLVVMRGERISDVVRRIGILQTTIDQIDKQLDGRFSIANEQEKLVRLYFLEHSDESFKNEIGRISIYSSRSHEVTLAKTDDGHYIRVIGRSRLESKLCSAIRNDVSVLHDCTIHNGPRDRITRALN